MKKEIIKKILLIIIALIIILPISVSAASFSVSATKSIVNPNDQVTLTFSSDTAFSASAISINYDSSKWTLVSNKALQGSEVPNVTASNIKTSISVTTGSIKGAFYQIVLQAKSDAVSGSSTVSVSTTDCWAEDGFTPIEMQKGSISFTHYVASSDSSLKSLSISNCLIDFKNTVTNYNCPLVDVDNVNISATANDSKATVSGAGNRKLNPGNNILKVIVTAENGSTKTYTININRKDNRNSDSSLSLLIVEGYDIDFRSDNLEYTITVPEDVRQVVVKATPGNSNSKITGIGTLNLSSGTNRFPVVVTAENGNIKTYFLNVLRNERIM